MNTPENLPFQYQVGGSLDANAPTYVKRRADDELYNYLRAKQYCYVLNSRQMGKSSLRVQTMQRLNNEGVQCAAIDLTQIGSENVDADAWYKGLFFDLVRKLELTTKIDRRSWWSDRASFSPVQRLRQFIEEVLLREIQQDIVIFIDEIDSVFSLNFSADDFFGLIRACYNQRVDDPNYHRLIFCLLGVATPSDFIRDKSRTPFNIGKAIELLGFQVEEADNLAAGLVNKTENPDQVIRHILHWTGGQPFLTQKLCQFIAYQPSIIPVGEEAEWIKQLVHERITKKNWETQDNPEHLRTIRNRLLNNEPNARLLLELYQQILQSGGIAADDSSEQVKLRLSGLVVPKNGQLTVYNPIYGRVFNNFWVKQQLHKLRPYAKQLDAWLDSGKDESRLLSGEALQEALEWSKGQSLSDRDHRFLNASQSLRSGRELELERQQSRTVAQGLLGNKINNPVEVINQVLQWTGGERVLTQKLCQLIIEFESSLPEGDEAPWIDQLVSDRIINNWQNGDAAEHLKTIRNQLISRDQQEARSILENYRQILQGRVVADYSPEQQNLLETGLVVNQQEYLEIPNRIYQAVFDLNWVEKELKSLLQSQNNPGVLAKRMATIALLIPLAAIFLYFRFPQKNEQSDRPILISPTGQQNPVSSEIPEVCLKIVFPLEEQIDVLEALEQQLENKFAQECQTQLNELKIILNAQKEGQKGRVVRAVKMLCQGIPDDSLNIEDAESWVSRWYNNKDWEKDVKRYLEKNPGCPAAQDLN